MGSSKLCLHRPHRLGVTIAHGQTTVFCLRYAVEYGRSGNDAVLVQDSSKMIKPDTLADTQNIFPQSCFNISKNWVG